MYISIQTNDKNMNDNKIYEITDRANLSPAEIKADQHFLLYAEIWGQCLEWL